MTASVLCVQAARAVSTIEAKAAAAQARLEGANAAERAAGHTRNVFKCGKCMRVRHDEASPLALCDTCPKAFHVACLGLTLADLPAAVPATSGGAAGPPRGRLVAAWSCPKCAERRVADERKLRVLQEKKEAALARVAAVRG